MEDEEIDEPKGKRGKKLGKMQFFLVLLLVGFALGALIEHLYIEPVLSSSTKELAECKSTSKLLDAENISCLKQLADLNKNN